jgi:hypothetical protein
VNENGTLVVTELEALALIEDELRKRHVASRSQGIVRLPPMLPKPVPPAEFWTRDESSMGAARLTPAAEAAAKVREFMRRRRHDHNYQGGSDGQ